MLGEKHLEFKMISRKNGPPITKHLECKLYINFKTHNYNINMQTSKQLSNINHVRVTLYHLLQKK